MNRIKTIPHKASTARLTIEPLSIKDEAFIFDLLNTAEWKRFIGDRNIHSMADALNYIQKITANPDVFYWTVRKKEDSLPIGIITFIKRSNFDFPDFGFAFLPEFSGKGYAREASEAIIDTVIKPMEFEKILAITLKDNEKSIKLLEKLNMTFEREIQEEKENLFVYQLNFAQ